jgi:hypothetical protein
VVMADALHISADQLLGRESMGCRWYGVKNTFTIINMNEADTRMSENRKATLIPELPMSLESVKGHQSGLVILYQSTARTNWRRLWGLVITFLRFATTKACSN